MGDLTLPGAGEASGSTGNTAAVSFAGLPSVDKLLGQPALAACVAAQGQALVKRAIVDELAAQREALRAGGVVASMPALVAAIDKRVAALAASTLRRVINLTGTVIHTNLGRAPMAEEAVDAVAAAMRGYTALEYDVAGGGRGDRDDLVEGLLRELTGVLGLRLQEKQGSGDADKFVDLLVEVRSEVRKQKLWAMSDLIRDRLKEMSVVIEDTKEGTKWRWG